MPVSGRCCSRPLCSPLGELRRRGAWPCRLLAGGGAPGALEHSPTGLPCPRQWSSQRCCRRPLWSCWTRRCAPACMATRSPTAWCVPATWAARWIPARWAPPAGFPPRGRPLPEQKGASSVSGPRPGRPLLDGSGLFLSVTRFALCKAWWAGRAGRDRSGAPEPAPARNLGHERP